jgi:hypothetical protein
MAAEVGAATHRLDHQWHYPFGVPDPRFPGQNRAVSVRNLNALWINARGRRFVNEWAASRYTVEAVVRQQSATYWLVFDAPGLDDLRSRHRLGRPRPSSAFSSTIINHQVRTPGPNSPRAADPPRPSAAVAATAIGRRGDDPDSTASA